MIDLHCHTTASDGTFTPQRLVKKASEIGLKALAITDHDTVEGIDEALNTRAILNDNIDIVPGVELSVEFSPGTMHLLGLFIDHHNIRLKETLSVLREFRNQRNPLMIKKLQELGVEITMEEVEKEAGGEVVSRNHMAKILVKKGYAKDINDAFKKYLSKDSPAYVARKRLSPEESIKLIHHAKGIAILCHPMQLKLGMGYELERLISDLKEIGLDGIEVYYSDHTEEQQDRFMELAQKNGLLISGGSDFHGDNKPDFSLATGMGNMCIPDSVYYKLVEFARR